MEEAEICFLLDTGAEISLISIKDFMRFWPEKEFVTKKIRAKQLDGSMVKILGYYRVRLPRVNKSINLWITTLKIEPILGWYDIRTLGPVYNWWKFFDTIPVSNDENSERIDFDRFKLPIIEDKQELVLDKLRNRTPEFLIKYRSNLEENKKTRDTKIIEVNSVEIKQEINNMVDQNVVEDMVDKEIKIILNRYNEVFKEELGTLKNFEVDIRLEENYRPKFCGIRRLPFSWIEEIDKELDKWLRDGIIKPIVHSEWATPLVPIKKPDNSLRLCIDYRVTVNKCVINEKYPLPRIEQLLANLRGDTLFSKIDFSNAYLQIKVSEKTSKILTITTHRGLFAFCRLPFGLKISAPIFQRTMTALFQGIKGIMYYLDDVLISGRTEEEHNARLVKVLNIIVENGLKANLKKSVFGVKEIKYLGHVIKGNEITPIGKNIDKIMNMRAPNNKAEVQAFLGATNYYHRFVQNFAEIATPLYDLLKKNKKFEWGEAQEKSFEKLKIKMVEKPILSCFNEKLNIILAVDASNEGIGGVLLQMIDNVEKPVLFLSRRFNSTEKNYSTIEREALALKFGLTKCKEYLIGKRFLLYTDHKPLVDLFKKENKELMISPRLQKWLILVGNFDFEIKFREGKQNCLPDILSRLFNKDIEDKEPVINSLEYIEEEENVNGNIIRAVRIDTREKPITFDIVDKISQKDEELIRIKACLKGDIEWKNEDKAFKKVE
ncbi:unnamed protein product [Gordionus sp. m RMFG-2023]